MEKNAVVGEVSHAAVPGVSEPDDVMTIGIFGDPVFV
jgi:hypothetical protein